LLAVALKAGHFWQSKQQYDKDLISGIDELSLLSLNMLCLQQDNKPAENAKLPIKNSRLFFIASFLKVNSKN
jgi:hypothetical protein